MAKTKKTEKEIKEPTVTKTEVQNVKEKTYKIRFDSDAALGFKDFGKTYEYASNGSIRSTQVIPEFYIKKNTEKVIDEATYKFLREKEALLTKKEREAVLKLKKEHVRKKYDRSEARTELSNLTPEEKHKVFNDLPYLVE